MCDFSFAIFCRSMYDYYFQRIRAIVKIMPDPQRTGIKLAKNTTVASNVDVCDVECFETAKKRAK